MTAPTRPIRTLIVDDDPAARAGLRARLGRDADLEVVGECGAGPGAVAEITARSPELVFLEVEMPRMAGFEVLKALGDERPFVVVFVTALDRYAFEALDVQALYVARPFDEQRFHGTVERAKDQVRHARLAHTGPEGIDHIAIRDGGRTVSVALSELDWIEATDYYVQLHVGKQAYLLREPLRKLEARLDPRRFVRIHRSVIVALDRIAELRPSAHGDHYVRLHDGTELRLSRSRHARLRALLAGRSEPPLDA